MKRAAVQIKRWVLLTFVILITYGAQSQHRLVLLHPTVSNIESMLWLVENKIIDIPGVELVGVYFAKEAYDYGASEKYLAKHPLKNYKLLKIEGEIQPQEIYRENSCTPSFRKLVDESDAILFFGGPDIPATVFGEQQHLLTVVTDPQRHYFETSLFFHLIGGSRNPAFKPLLNHRPDFIIRAFCLGMQTMNVASGGTLIQDIPMEVYHLNTLEKVAAQPSENQHRSYVSPQYPMEDLFGGNFHPIRISKTGYLHEMAVRSGVAFPKVLSYHHQAVGRKGLKLKVMATSVDGKIVEGLQHADFINVVGVQFHPEPSSLYKTDSRLTTEPGKSYSPKELLKSSNSLKFHQQFWTDFSEKVIQSKRNKLN